jgi:hypothetical protein
MNVLLSSDYIAIANLLLYLTGCLSGKLIRGSLLWKVKSLALGNAGICK